MRSGIITQKATEGRLGIYINKADRIIKEFQKIKSGDNEIRLSVIENYKDRIRKIDSHFIWSVVLHESAKYSRIGKNTILSLIGEYYSTYHCCFSISALDIGIEDQKLGRVTHSGMEKLLKILKSKRILGHKIMDLYNDSRWIREYVNYLSGSSGLDKFKLLRDFHTIKSKCFGEVSLDVFSLRLGEENDRLIDEFVTLTKQIENKCHRNIFPFLHMVNDFDYYGEDFLMTFFIGDSLVEEEVRNFLMGLDSSR